MVEAVPSCVLLGGFAIGARVALLWQHNANPSYKLASIPRYDDIVRTAGWAGSARAAGRRPAGDGGRPQNRAAGPPPTGVVLNITAAVLTAGFHWWRSGNKKRTQNVSEYMLVLALCLVKSICFLQLWRNQIKQDTYISGKKFDVRENTIEIRTRKQRVVYKMSNSTINIHQLSQIKFTNQSSAVSEMGDRLATIDIGRKVGGRLLCPFP